MEKVKYRLSTISSLIVSLRSNLAWYKDLDEFHPDMFHDSYLNKEQLKIIYPFYQYGEYEKWSLNASYYIPGSSIKGAFGGGTIMVDDVQIPNERMVLRNLYKVQYLKEADTEKAKLDVFFNNVGVEMVKAGTVLDGELYLDSAAGFHSVMDQTNQSAKKKMMQMVEYISRLCETDYEKNLKNALHIAATGLEALIQADDVILLGGYKGLLHSMEMKLPTLAANEGGGIFLDMESGLPHGLVRLQALE